MFILGALLLMYGVVMLFELYSYKRWVREQIVRMEEFTHDVCIYDKEVAYLVSLMQKSMIDLARNPQSEFALRRIEYCELRLSNLSPNYALMTNYVLNIEKPFVSRILEREMIANIYEEE